MEFKSPRRTAPCQMETWHHGSRGTVSVLVWVDDVELTPPHPIEQIDIANEQRIRGHPCIRS